MMSVQAENNQEATPTRVSASGIRRLTSSSATSTIASKSTSSSSSNNSNSRSNNIMPSNKSNKNNNNNNKPLWWGDEMSGLSIDMSGALTLNNYNDNDSDPPSGAFSVARDYHSKRTISNNSVHTSSSSTSTNLIKMPQSAAETRSNARLQSMDLAICRLKFDALPLFGRSAELARLQSMVDRLLGWNNNDNNNDTDKIIRQEREEAFQTSSSSSSSSGLVLIDGVSGSGKTTLALQLESMIHAKKRGGMVAMAKCELGGAGSSSSTRSSEPFACIENVMDSLCQQILNLPLRPPSESSSSPSSMSPSSLSSSPLVYLEDIQERLLAELDETEMEALIPSIPGLAQILFGILSQPPSLQQQQAKQNNHNSHTTMETSKDATAYKEEASRLKYAARHFIRIVGQSTPLILFLDDCQWADAASIGWIKSLLLLGTDTDASNKNNNNHNNNHVTTTTTTNGRGSNILVAISYRTNEVDDPEHELMKMMTELKKIQHDATKKNRFLMEEIHVGNLSVEQTNELLSTLLSIPNESETLELAKTLHQKTMGNAFFVVQFIMRLQEDNYLSFSLGLLKWTWESIDEIKANYQSTDNVADLMKDKLQNNSRALRVLPIAACLGSTFSLEVLRKVIAGVQQQEQANNNNNNHHQDPTKEEAEQDETEDSILEFCDQGFLEPAPSESDGSGRIACRFVHDKIQEAALSFVTSDTKISIGNVLLKLFSTRQEALEGDMVYAAISLLDSSIIQQQQQRQQQQQQQQSSKEQLSLLDDPIKRLQIIQLNAWAGRKALECSAFEAASKYLSTAITLLPSEDPFLEHKKLSVEIYTMAAAADFCTGNLQNVRVYCDAVMEREDVSSLDKVAICLTMMDQYESTFESLENFKLGKRILKDFGRRFPSGAVAMTAKTVAGLLKAKFRLKKRLSTKKLAAEPITTDERTLAIMRLLDKFSSATYHAKPELLPLVLLESTNCSEQLGLNAYSAAAYPFVGLIFAGVFEDFATAKICGDAGIQIMRRCNFPTVNARCIMLAYGLCIHWSTPLHDCLKTLLEGYETGMKMGTMTTDSAFGAIHFYLSFSFWTGLNLSTMHVDYTTYIDQMEEYGCEKAAVMTKPNRHIITRLCGLPDEMDPEEVISFSRERKDPVVECFLRWAQIWLACFEGKHEYASKLSLEWVPKIMKLLAAHNIVLETIFVSALSSFATVRKTGKKKTFLKHATFCHKKIKSWVGKGNPNCVAHEALLEAEALAVKKQKALAVRSFEVAVLLAGRRGLIHVQALANERFAVYLQEVGEIEDATYRYDQAQLLYVEWGAAAKAKQVQEMRERMAV